MPTFKKNPSPLKYGRKSSGFKMKGSPYKDTRDFMHAHDPVTGKARQSGGRAADPNNSHTKSKKIKNPK